MKEKRNDNLIYEGNAFYEVDRECMKKGLNQKEEKEGVRRTLKNRKTKNGKLF